MIDINLLKRAAEQGRPIELEQGALKQLIVELEAGRRAQAQAGQTFGLPENVRL